MRNQAGGQRKMSGLKAELDCLPITVEKNQAIAMGGGF
jgi:hypothetical protein